MSDPDRIIRNAEGAILALKAENDRLRSALEIAEAAMKTIHDKCSRGPAPSGTDIFHKLSGPLKEVQRALEQKSST